MILQALYDYYIRKSKDPESGIPAEGFENKVLDFLVVLNKEGNFIQFADTRQGEGKKKIGRLFQVPQGSKRTAGIAANLLWDNVEYALGYCNTEGFTDAKKEKKALEKTKQKHKTFGSEIDEKLSAIKNDEGLNALKKFLQKKERSILEKDPCWPEIISTNPFISFRLEGDTDIISNRPQIRNFLLKDNSDMQNNNCGVCLVTGEKAELARIHPSIKGVYGAQTTGASIVSFNFPAACSYGKEQSFNSPVSKKSAFCYTTALNFLLRKGSQNRLSLADTSTMFWSEKKTQLEQSFGWFFDTPKDHEKETTTAVQELYKSIHNGVYVKDDGNTRFYLLGLAPNAARISIRFWQVGTVSSFATRIKEYFDDLDIIGKEKFGYPPLSKLLREIALQGKSENIPPNLTGETIRSILNGAVLPTILLQAVIRRIRAEQSSKNNVNYYRAALIKACINRNIRASKSSDVQREVEVSLDINNQNTGYLLGRLFAVLEKTQEEASPGLNATIRDRFYGASSSTPATVFPTLLKLKNHHIAKLEKPGRKIRMEKLIGEIMSGLNKFPNHLSLNDQGMFAIGYYHQRQNFYTTVTVSEKEE